MTSVAQKIERAVKTIEIQERFGPYTTSHRPPPTLPFAEKLREQLQRMERNGQGERAEKMRLSLRVLGKSVD